MGKIVLKISKLSNPYFHSRNCSDFQSTVSNDMAKKRQNIRCDDPPMGSQCVQTGKFFEDQSSDYSKEHFITLLILLLERREKKKNQMQRKSCQSKGGYES
jgi:hypothetical protein